MPLINNQQSVVNKSSPLVRISGYDLDRPAKMSYTTRMEQLKRDMKAAGWAYIGENGSELLFIQNTK